MKTIITTIINEKVLGQDSINFQTKSEFENHINGLMSFISDKQLEIESDNKEFSIKETDIYGDHITTFSSDNFKSIIMDNCIGWEEAGVKTICSFER